MTVTGTQDYTLLGHLGRCDADRIISICVAWPSQIK